MYEVNPAKISDYHINNDVDKNQLHTKLIIYDISIQKSTYQKKRKKKTKQLAIEINPKMTRKYRKTFMKGLAK